MPMQWKIYYTDGSTYTDQDGEPQHAPGHLGVQVIIQVSDHTGRHNLLRFDYYVWQEGEWFGVDLMGLLFYLQRPGWRKVLAGELISDKKFREIFAMAEEDTDLPPRSAFQPHERRD